ncbi:hypothetical protein PMAYCL1PPCAC_21999, partial [Pristionchus mayeri]
ISRPFINHLSFHLRNDEECADLANLAQVSTHYYSGVHKFMMRPVNRPGLKCVNFSKDEDGMSVEIQLYPSNLPFHCLDTLDARRVKKFRGFANPILEVTLNTLNDPIVIQVAGMLSSCIKNVRINAWTLSSADFLLCSQLLRNSDIGNLLFHTTRMGDDAASFILSTAHTKELTVVCNDPQLSNPAAFITQLASKVQGSTLYDDSDSTTLFFGLPHSFWNKFLNEKLANGSFESIGMGNMEGEITKAPFVLPDTPLESVKWYKKD